MAFGAAATGGSLDDLRAALRSRLEDLRSHLQRGFLVVDEAQNFSARDAALPDAASGARIGGEEGSLQVIISGQPGLVLGLLVEAAGARGWSRAATLPTAADEHDGHGLLCAPSAAGRRLEGWANLLRRRPRSGSGGDGRPAATRQSSLRSRPDFGLSRRTRDIDSMRVARAAAELRAELDEPGVPFPPLDDQAPTQADRRCRLRAAACAAAAVLGSRFRPLRRRRPSAGRVRRGRPATRNASLPSARLRAALIPSRAPGPHRAAAVAAGLLALSVGWTAYDRSSRRDTTPARRLSRSCRARDQGRPRQVPPAAGVECPGRPGSRAHSSDAQSAVGRVQEPARPSSQPLDARAALGLAPATEPTTTPPPPRLLDRCPVVQRRCESARTLFVTMQEPVAPRSRRRSDPLLELMPWAVPARHRRRKGQRPDPSPKEISVECRMNQPPLKRPDEAAVVGEPTEHLPRAAVSCRSGSRR